MLELDFATWKAEYEPVIYEDTGAWCEEHEEQNKSMNPTDWCDCEFLYTYELAEMEHHEGLAEAISERRVWTWNSDGTISSGIADERADLLITAKAYEQDMIIK